MYFRTQWTERRSLYTIYRKKKEEEEKVGVDIHGVENGDRENAHIQTYK